MEEKSKSIKAEYSYVKLRKGYLLGLQKKYEDALQLTCEALEIMNYESPEAIKNLTYFSNQIESPNILLGIYHKMTLARPELPEGHYFYGSYLIRDKKYDQALDELG